MKALKNAIIAAIVTFVTFTILGPAGMNLLSSTFVMSTAVATAAVGTFVASGIGNMMSKGVDVGAGNFGTKMTIKGAANPRQLIYGECVVGGTLCYIDTKGTDNNRLQMVIAFAGHEVNDIVDVRVNGEALSTGASTINSTTVYTAENANYTNTDNDNAWTSGRLIRYTKHLGTSDQAYDQYAANQIGASWTSNHRLRGIAYIFIQFIFDTEKFSGGMPQITAKIQGKKVYDPRTTNTTFSKNPALCIRDYLTDTTNGLGALSTEINDSSGTVGTTSNYPTSTGGGFVTAANICDQDVNDSSGSAEDRYTMNGFFHTGGEPAAVIESMLSACAGKISYSNGKFNLFAGAAQTPTLTITDDDILSPVNIATQPDTSNLFNGVKGIYVDAQNKYQAADIPIHQNSTYLNADTPSGGATVNYEKYMELQFPYTQSESTAQRLARIGLKANRQTATVSMTVSLKFYQLQVGDWVKVTNSRMSWTNKYFEVMGMGFDAVGGGSGEEAQYLAVVLVLKETATDVFAFDTSNDYESSVTVETPTTTDPTTATVAAPTNLTLTNVTTFAVNFHRVKVAWTAAAPATIMNTEIQYKVTSEADSTYSTAALVPRETEITFINGLAANTQHTVRIRHKGRFGNYSSWVSGTITTGGTSIGSDDILNSEVDSPTHTTSTSDPSGTAVVGSTHLKTGVTPQELWIYTTGTGWVHQQVNVDTDTTYVLPTHTSGSGVPNNNTTPSPNPLNSTYLNTATTPDTLYISDGTNWVLMGTNSDTIYTLPNNVLIGAPSVSGQTITFTRNSGSAYTLNTQDTTYTIDTVPNSPFDSGGDIDTNFSLNATMAMGTTNAAHKITVGSNLTIDGDNERILITDAT